jgi:hypothetical protein
MTFAAKNRSPGSDHPISFAGMFILILRNDLLIAHHRSMCNPKSVKSFAKNAIDTFFNPPLPVLRAITAVV